MVAMGVLDASQVAQILEHQKLSRQRFGQIAVSWGWAKPQDVWQAWARQLAADDRFVDLEDLGVDTSAVERVPPALAWYYRAVAVRAWGEHLVVAVPESLVALARRELPAMLPERLYFCLADPEQIDRALAKAYTIVTV